MPVSPRLVRGLRPLLGGVVVVLALAACSEDPGVGLPAGGSPTAGGSPSGVQPTVDDEPTAADGGADVSLEDFAIVPEDLDVGAGDEINVANTTAGTPHTFTITGTDIDVVLEGGAEEQVTIDLEPGDYDVICRFHESAGMRGTLTVSA